MRARASRGVAASKRWWSWRRRARESHFVTLCVRVCVQELAYSLMLDVAKGLEYLHSLGIIHGGARAARVGARVSALMASSTCTHSASSTEVRGAPPYWGILGRRASARCEWPPEGLQGLGCGPADADGCPCAVRVLRVLRPADLTPANVMIKLDHSSDHQPLLAKLTVRWPQCAACLCGGRQGRS